MISHLPGGNGLRRFPQQGSPVVAQFAVGKTPRQQTKHQQRTEQRQHRRVGEAQTAGPLTIHFHRFVHARNASSPITQSWLSCWTSRRRRLAVKPIFRNAGRFVSPLLTLKSRGLLMVVSVRNARPSLWYCLILLTLVVHVQRGHDPFGQHPGAEPARGPLGHPPLENQLHLVRPPEVQILADDLLEEGPARLGTIQHLGQRELRLQDRYVVAIPGLAVRGGVRVRQPGQPLSQQRVDLVGRESQSK